MDVWMDGWVLECVCEYVRVCVRACACIRSRELIIDLNALCIINILLIVVFIAIK